MIDLSKYSINAVMNFYLYAFGAFHSSVALDSQYDNPEILRMLSDLKEYIEDRGHKMGPAEKEVLEVNARLFSKIQDIFDDEMNNNNNPSL